MKIEEMIIEEQIVEERIDDLARDFLNVIRLVNNHIILYIIRS